MWGHIWSNKTNERESVLSEKEERAPEDEMVRWHHWLNGHEFEQTPGDGGGQRSLACCSPWGHKELDTTEQLNKNWVKGFSFPFSFKFPWGSFVRTSDTGNLVRRHIQSHFLKYLIPSASPCLLHSRAPARLTATDNRYPYTLLYASIISFILKEINCTTFICNTMCPKWIYMLSPHGLETKTPCFNKAAQKTPCF